MALVASCPQCNHDLLVPSDADGDAWGKCPDCRAFFQVGQATSRELPSIRLVAAHEAAHHALSDVENGRPESQADEAPDTPSAPAADAEPRPDDPRPIDEPATDRIDQWFRQAKSLAESQPGSPSELSGLEKKNWKDDEIALPPQVVAPRSDVQVDRDGADDVSFGSGAMPVADQSPPELPRVVRTAPAARGRKPSALRALVLSAVAGVVGLAVGYYALLWLRGSSGDFLDLAQYFPQAVLPAELKLERGPSPWPAAVPHAAAPHDSFAEPARFDATAAASFAGDGTFVAEAPVAGVPSFAASELAAALEAARRAQPDLVSGDLADGESTQQAKGQAFARFADLAQKVVLVDRAGEPDTVAPLQQAAVRLFRQTLATPRIRSEVAQIVPRWIESPNRDQGGVFFAADLAQLIEADGLFECRAELEGGYSLALFGPAELVAGGDIERPVGVVGWIIDEPAEQNAGFDDGTPRTVWVGTLFSLE